MGSLYRLKLKSGRRSEMWWAKYYVNGRPVRESTGVSSDTETPPAEARRFLKRREGAEAHGAPIPPRLDRIRYDELATDLRDFYRTTGRRRLDEVEDRLAYLDPFFKGRRAATIDPPLITQYVAARQAQRKLCAVPGSSGAAGCGAGGVMAWERGRGEGARGRGGR